MVSGAKVRGCAPFAESFKLKSRFYHKNLEVSDKAISQGPFPEEERQMSSRSGPDILTRCNICREHPEEQF